MQCPNSASVGSAGSTFGAALNFFAAAQCLLTEPWPPRASLKNESYVDVIIVGGGTAGSALAARLSEAALTVLLLEAGDDPPVDAIVPGLKGSLPGSRYDYNYTTVDDGHSSQFLAGKRQTLIVPKILGGGGSFNSMIYSRGYPADYDEWAHIVKDSTWKYKNVVPYFKKSEILTDISILNSTDYRKYHGTHGEIEVAGLKQLNFDTTQFINGFAELGINVVADRNNPEEIGAGHLSFTIKNGLRQSSASAMLNAAGNRENLYVMTKATVTKVLVDKDTHTAYGVKVVVDGNKMVFYADKEVVLSAGTYNTPRILMVSGIGPKNLLSKFGIELIQDLPVGENLHDHVSVKTYIAAEKGTCALTEAAKLFDVVKYLYNRTGSLSIPSRIGVDYALKKSKNQNIPDFAIFPFCAPVNNDYYQSCVNGRVYTPEVCSRLAEISKDYEVLTFNVRLVTPKSRGVVSLASNNIFDKPIVYSGTFSKEEDLKGYPEALNLVWSLTNTSYFKSKGAFVVDLGLQECEKLEWPKNAKCFARGVADTDSHSVGTAAMGKVLDSRLRVIGVKKLRVVDASAMPKVVRGNINTPVIMMADKLADFIKSEHGLCEPDKKNNLLCKINREYL